MNYWNIATNLIEGSFRLYTHFSVTEYPLPREGFYYSCHTDAFLLIVVRMYAFAAYRRTLKIDCPLLSSWLVGSVTFLRKSFQYLHILQTLVLHSFINFVIFFRTTRSSRSLKTMSFVWKLGSSSRDHVIHHE